MLEFDKNDLKFIGPCPVCRFGFAPGNIKTLKNRGATSLLHADCDNCESSILITLIKNGAGVITNVGILTDLYKDDFARFKNMPVVSTDDISRFSDNRDKKNDNFRAKK